MQPRAALSNGIITIVVVFFMLMIAMVLKARYKFATNAPVETTEQIEPAVPKAIPVAMAIEPEIHQPRAYQQGDWWVLPNPELVVSRANEADTMRIRSGVKEDVFVLYFVDAPEVYPTRPKRLRDQASYFQIFNFSHLLTCGKDARQFVTELLTTHPFTVFTKWGRVPDSERFYAMIRIEMQPGKTYDLGEILVRHGYAAPTGQQTGSLPPDSDSKTTDQYLKKLAKALSTAKAEGNGIWGISMTASKDAEQP